MKVLRGLGMALLLLLVSLMFLVAIAVLVLASLRIPQKGAGITAKTVCSSIFVGGRETPVQDVLDSDVIAADPLLGVVSATVDLQERTVTGRFLGIFSREAAFLGERGCVLNGEPDPTATPYVAAPARSGTWPEGDEPVTSMPADVDAEALAAVVDAAFADAGDPAGQNTRGVAVVKGDQLLVAKESPVLPSGSSLHGWSMTKTVAAMLAIKRFEEVGLDVQTPVVDTFPAGREPAWVAEWRGDERARITVADLLFMRSGLDMNEGYSASGDVPEMLYAEPDMAAFAASRPAAYPAGTYWEYLSGVSNILAAVTRAQFASDEEYWAYPRTVLYGPLGLQAGTMETDTSGTWVASSYQWGTTVDWARLGQLLLTDGNWQGEQILPDSWAALATTPAVPDGEGHGYGAQTWLLGDPVGGECKDYPGVPQDTIAMEGHWGQVVAAIPSLDAVIVRLGWTFDRDQFDECQFISDVAASLQP